MPRKKKAKQSVEGALQYKGRHVQIRKVESAGTKALSDDTPQIVINIDGTELGVREEDGTYSSILLPYDSYASPEALARDVIDYVPAFKR